jgi:hypothetical protein
MTAICNFFKDKFFTSAPPLEKQSSGPKFDEDYTDERIKGVDVGQKTKVLSKSNSSRHPGSLFARAVLWEATSWMNPTTEELKRDKGLLLNKLKPLAALGRSVARLVYSLVVPLIAGMAGIVYHPAKAFYQLCRSGWYKVTNKDSDENMNKLAIDAFTLAEEHSAAFLVDLMFTVVYGVCLPATLPTNAFKCLNSSWMQDVVRGAFFSTRDSHLKKIAENEVALRHDLTSCPCNN